MAKNKSRKRRRLQHPDQENSTKRIKGPQSQFRNQSVKKDGHKNINSSPSAEDPFNSRVSQWDELQDGIRNFRSDVAEYEFIEERMKRDLIREEDLSKKRRGAMGDRWRRVSTKLRILQARIKTHKDEKADVSNRIHSFFRNMQPDSADLSNLRTAILHMQSWCVLQEQVSRPIHPDPNIEAFHAYDAKILNWERTNNDVKHCREVVDQYNALDGQSQQHKTKFSNLKASTKAPGISKEINTSRQKELNDFRYIMADLDKKLYYNAKKVWVFEQTAIGKVAGLSVAGIPNLQEFIRDNSEIPKPQKPNEHSHKKQRGQAKNIESGQKIQTPDQPPPKSIQHQVDAVEGASRQMDSTLAKGVIAPDLSDTKLENAKTERNSEASAESMNIPEPSHTTQDVVENAEYGASSGPKPADPIESAKCAGPEENLATPQPAAVPDPNSATPMAITAPSYPQGDVPEPNSAAAVESGSVTLTGPSQNPAAARGTISGWQINHPLIYAPGQLLLDTAPKFEGKIRARNRAHTANDAEKKALVALKEPALPPGYQRGNIVGLNFWDVYEEAPYIYIPKSVLPFCEDWFAEIKQWNLGGIRVTDVRQAFTDDFGEYSCYVVITCPPKLCSNKPLEDWMGCTQYAYKELTKLTFHGFHLGKALLWPGIKHKEKFVPSAPNRTQAQLIQEGRNRSGNNIPRSLEKKWEEQE